jgi:transportin-3
MATNGSEPTFAAADVLAAVATMRGGQQENKKKAHEYLEKFQKSVGCEFATASGGCLWHG